MRFLSASVASLVLAFALIGAGEKSNRQSISLAELRDKIEGGWAGQMIGVSLRRAHRVPLSRKDDRRRPPEVDADRVSNSLNQDDLYVDMTFAKVLDDKGLNATTADFGAMFRDAKYSAVARESRRRGAR